MSAVALWTRGGGVLSTTNPKQKTLEFTGPKAVQATPKDQS
jgi:hypothetical protein